MGDKGWAGPPGVDGTPNKIPPQKGDPGEDGQRGKLNECLISFLIIKQNII